jgi:uncharacterized protein YjbI with pentapeptide repeats
LTSAAFLTSAGSSIARTAASGTNVEIDALKAMLLAHKLWLRNERGGRRADLSLKVLRNYTLPGIDLTRGKLTGVQLIQCDLSDAKLFEADLFGANLAKTIFIRADCRGVDFRGAQLSGADFSEAKLSGCDFRDGMLMVSVDGSAKPAEHERDTDLNARIGMTRANLEGARLRSAVARKADLSGANLRTADLTTADLTDASLKDADLRGSNLSGCNLTGVRMNRANIEGAKLDGAKLKDANIHGVAFDKALFNHLDVSEAIAVDDSTEAALGIRDRLTAHELWVSSNGAEGERGDFTASDLSGVDFSDRNLSAAVFQNARLRSATFLRSIIELTDFTGADLTAANFTRANLRGSNFTEAILHRADFRNADLRVNVANLPNGMTREFPVTFVNCRLGDTNFTDVEFDRVKAAHLKLHGVIAAKEFLALLQPQA